MGRTIVQVRGDAEWGLRKYGQKLSPNLKASRTLNSLWNIFLVLKSLFILLGTGAKTIGRTFL